MDGSIGDLTTGGSVSGVVRVQRFITNEAGGAVNGLFRSISAPVSGLTVLDWQNEFPITGDFTGTSAAAGDTIDIYVLAVYSATDTDIGGAIDALLGPDNIEAEDTSFIKANLRLMDSGSLHGTPTTVIGYHWGPHGVAQFFGGIMPKKFMLICHANTASSLTGTNAGNVNVIGIKYVTA